MKKLIFSTVLLCVAPIAALDLEPIASKYPKQVITLKSSHPGDPTEYSITLGALKLLEPLNFKIDKGEDCKSYVSRGELPYAAPALKMLVPIYNALAQDPDMSKQDIIQVLETIGADPGINFKADQADGKKLENEQVERLRLFFLDMSDLPGHAGNTVANAVGRYLQEKDLRPLPTTQVLRLFKVEKNLDEETQENIYMPFAQQLYVSIAQFITDTNVTKFELWACGIETLVGMQPLDNLKILFLQNNKLSGWQDIPWLPKLKRLTLENNPLNTVDKKMFPENTCVTQGKLSPRQSTSTQRQVSPRLINGTLRYVYTKDSES